MTDKEKIAGRIVPDGAGLQPEQAGDDLHVVLDPVMNLTQHDLLLLQGAGVALFGVPFLQRHGGLVGVGSDDFLVFERGGF